MPALAALPLWATIVAAVVFVLLVAGLLFLRLHTKKGVWTWLLVVVILLGLAVVVGRLVARSQEVDLSEQGEIDTVIRGNLAAVVEATGNLAPVAQTNLAFATAGRLHTIMVSTGDYVKKGQALARLDTTDLELQLAQAQAGLKVAEANLEKVLAGARPEEVISAQSTLAQAVANRQELEVTLAAATEQARLSWIQTANALRDAQASYSKIYWDNRELEQRLARFDQELPEANKDAEAKAWRAVENAEAAMEQARLSYEQALQRQQSSLESARSQVVSAQANLERVRSGATTQDIAVYQASLEQSRAAVAVAQAQLDKATLTAPFDGIVATVLAEENSQVSAATPILILADLSAYYVDVEVDEVDISSVQTGQAVSITLDALPDVELAGRVSEMALAPTPGQGVVTYRVRVQIGATGEATVRPGMTANVRIITRRATNVLLVRRRALQSQNGLTYVERVLPGDQLERVPVEIGLQDPTYAEIVSGLQEGDRVFVRGVVVNPLQQLMQQPAMGGGFRPATTQP